MTHSKGVPVFEFLAWSIDSRQERAGSLVGFCRPSIVGGGCLFVGSVEHMVYSPGKRYIVAIYTD